MPRGRPQSARAAKIKWVLDHDWLWHRHHDLACALKGVGLYSASTYTRDINTCALVAEARAARDVGAGEVPDEDQQ